MVPEADKLQYLKDQLAEARDDVAASITYILGLNDILPHLAMAPVCAVSGGQSLFGDSLATSTAITISARFAADWLNERVEPHTHAKVSYFDETAPFMVGPLARLTMSMPPEYAANFRDASIRSSLKARIVELQQAVERAQILIELLLDGGPVKEAPVTVIPTQGWGTSLMEAPRGVLLHSYCFDDQGVCCAADIITPTAINQGAMAASLKALVAAMYGAEYDQVKACAEILIRCYDPCISCAVH
jgi:coenzyme F420-reducing hydrogenase alpha subunit